MISLHKCSGTCNSVDELSAKICVPTKKNDVNGKVFNMTTNRNEAKTVVKHTSFDCKCKFNILICNSNQKSNNQTCQCQCKNYRPCKKKL